MTRYFEYSLMIWTEKLLIHLTYFINTLLQHFFIDVHEFYSFPLYNFLAEAIFFYCYKIGLDSISLAFILWIRVRDRIE